MHTSNLLEFLLPELIQFILVYLPEQDLKNSRSINSIWEREANHVLFERIKFQMQGLPQGNYTVKEFYLKLKEQCNLSKDYLEEQLKWLFLNGLSSENKIKVLMDSLQMFALDKIVERLSDLPVGSFRLG